MLGELYKYAVDNNLAVRPGFKEKNVKRYISFGADGSFLGFDANEDKPFCPDIGSLANGATKSNIIAEKAEVILNLADSNGEKKRQIKHDFYMDSMRSAAEHDALFASAVSSLEKNLDTIAEAFVSEKLKPGDILSIKYNGKPLERSEDYLEWWESFRKSYNTAREKNETRCFITGDLTQAMSTVPPFNGLISVGGQTKGDSLICFDKDAYRSYGLEQAANASVSENAVAGVNIALTRLLNTSQRLAGMKNIHWFSQKTEHDIIEMLDYDLGWDTAPDNPVEEQVKEITEDQNKIKGLFNYVFDGKCLEQPNNRYYMLSLCGVGGRVMIRSYDEGSYEDLYNNIKAWYEDLKLENRKYPKLLAIYSRLLKKSSDNKKISERIATELSGIAPQIMYSVLHNTPLPDTVAVKALAYIRSDMYSTDESGRSKHSNIDGISCQILKAWLSRKYRAQKKEEFIFMDSSNSNNPSKAYYVGGLMAAYAALQKKALGDVGAGVVQRYYASACTSPALVIGKLATLAQYHLSKLEKKDYVFYTNMLQELSVKIGSSLPKTFSLEEQSEFALGYYYQNSIIYTKKIKENTEE